MRAGCKRLACGRALLKERRMSEKKGEQLPPVVVQLPAQGQDGDYGGPDLAKTETPPIATTAGVVVKRNGFAPDPKDDPFEDMVF
ncbi:hypothetical protein A3C86_04965 [Candidatus Kaiserbacteria bacterium RIFCSPHIGHO2_02_FULL_49_16]|uniref:Uncharacterized protein n=1 Tax=Candidatus Kaiserbacteria bacterium RIFCSPHIGHO2_02_FULL_49_16 TaxID=1798490 RepID=A0A1F6DG81_9BACT|nr:MAG: hypothetical protein A3C86_04965 [Candidatus Kaiserbacteria bacterium RIFCSPHIGHO2_02_FULL_49_16]